MKRIGLLRHGKAEHQALDGSDFDRDLTIKGASAASAVAEKGLRLFDPPERLISSPARRALRTARIFIESTGLSVPLDIRDEVYAADADDLLSIVAGLPDEIESIIIVGHNPSLEDTIVELTGDFVRLKTAHLYMIDMDISGWMEIFSPSPLIRQKMIAQMMIKP